MKGKRFLMAVALLAMLIAGAWLAMLAGAQGAGGSSSSVEDVATGNAVAVTVPEEPPDWEQLSSEP